jgi:hypothetical protein
LRLEEKNSLLSRKVLRRTALVHSGLTNYMDLAVPHSCLDPQFDPQAPCIKMNRIQVLYAGCCVGLPGCCYNHSVAQLTSRLKAVLPVLAVPRANAGPTFVATLWSRIQALITSNCVGDAKMWTSTTCHSMARGEPVLHQIGSAQPFTDPRLQLHAAKPRTAL